MTKTEFYNNIAKTYFKPTEIKLNDLTIAIKKANPIFGELKLEIIEETSGYILKYLDEDIVTSVLKPDKNTDGFIEVQLTDEEIEKYSTTTRIITINTDLNGMITSASHGMNGFFTIANKDMVLFIGNLIGKTIIGL